MALSAPVAGGGLMAGCPNVAGAAPMDLGPLSPLGKAFFHENTIVFQNEGERSTNANVTILLSGLPRKLAEPG